ncbi:MAG: hypothetical protein IPM80_00010 [Proteobacteria bacterium]|nr:hypothetical protein [Pseudomonadota bacterium]
MGTRGGGVGGGGEPGCLGRRRGQGLRGVGAGYSGSDALVTNLQEHVKRVTAPYKYPRRIEFVDSLPKTVSGKIRRVELRAREAGAG